jgi:hypothetical protein
MTVMLLLIAIEMPQVVVSIIVAVIGKEVMQTYGFIEDIFEMLTVLYR